MKTCKFRGIDFPNPFRIIVKDHSKGLDMVEYVIDDHFFVRSFSFNRESKDEIEREGYITVECHDEMFSPSVYKSISSWDLRWNLFIQQTEEPIFEHPQFKEPRFNWGVTPAKTIYKDLETIDLGDEEEEDDEYESGIDYVIPEDWSTHLPQYDGMSLMDFWDAEKGEFVNEGPPELKAMLGVKTFLRGKPVFELV